MHRVKKKRRTNVLLRLQQEYQAALRQHRFLILQNGLLRQREQFLLEAVQEQGDNLHYVALAAFQQEQQLLEACTCTNPDACTCGAGEAAAVTATLLEDLKVFQMLQMVGGAAAAGGATEPNTTQWMRAAITPERVAEIRSWSLEDIAAKLRSLTMRLSHFLHTKPQQMALLSSTLDDVVFEYGQMGMLLHVAADRSNLEIGVLNLETLQRQEPPEGHWEFVLESLELRPEQQDSLCTGFEQYIATSAPVIAELQELGRRMQQLTGAPAPGPGSAAAEDTPCSSFHTGDCAPHAPGSSSSSSAGDSDIDEDEKDDDKGCDAANHEAISTGLLDSGHKSLSQILSPPPAAAAAGGGGGGGGQRDIGSSAWSGSGIVPLQNEQGAAAPMEWQQQQQLEQPVDQLGSRSHNMGTHFQTLEMYAELEEAMKQLLNRVMKLRELHRTVTFLWLNTLDTRQQALAVVHSYPFWSRPLSMTRLLAQQRGITDPTAAAAAGRTTSGTPAGTAAGQHGS